MRTFLLSRLPMAPEQMASLMQSWQQGQAKSIEDAAKKAIQYRLAQQLARHEIRNGFKLPTQFGNIDDAVRASPNSGSATLHVDHSDGYLLQGLDREERLTVINSQANNSVKIIRNADDFSEAISGVPKVRLKYVVVELADGLFSNSDYNAALSSIVK